MMRGYINKRAPVSENHTPTSFSDWLAQYSQLSPLFADFRGSFSKLAQLPPNVLLLCQIRMAQLHGVGSHSGSSDARNALAKAVSMWPDSEQFSEGEKACLAFAEVYAIDVHSITDAHANAVKQHFGEPGLVALVQALGVLYSEVRLGKLWGFNSPATEHPV